MSSIAVDDDPVFEDWWALINACGAASAALTEERQHADGTDREWFFSGNISSSDPEGECLYIEAISHGPDGAAGLDAIRHDARVYVISAAVSDAEAENAPRESSPVVLRVSDAAANRLPDGVHLFADSRPDGAFTSAPVTGEDLLRVFAAVSEPEDGVTTPAARLGAAT